MTYRLGIDIGTNSLGWCLLDLNADGDPRDIRDIGVRIFPDGRDPKSKTSLAVDRRIKRGMRRRRDRYLLRRADLMRALVRHGLMPEDAAARKALEKRDPYELRAKGLDEPLHPHELGRALFHLNQRRGFRSNRKTERRQENESGKIKTGGARLREAMEKSGARTLGAFFHNRRLETTSVRARLRGEGAKAEYDFYPQRDLLEAEFDLLWAAQAGRQPAVLTDSARDELRRIIFRQRDLRPVDPGKCTLDPARDKADLGGFRAPWALPIAQKFRIYQELNNLTLIAPDRTQRPLSREHRDRIASELFRKGKVTFVGMRRLLKLDSDVAFNLEGPKRDHLKGDGTAHVLAAKGRFGPAWQSLDEGRQAEIVEKLLSEEDEDALVAWLRDECRLGEEAARAVADAPLPDSYARVGRRALAKIVPIMRDQGLNWADAAREAGYHHSDFRPDGTLHELPYYAIPLQRHVSGTGEPKDPPEKRYGRIANPTVHIGLNQLRKLVNAVVARHGKPDEVVVELARELKLGREEKERIAREQKQNQDANDKRRAKLADAGQPDTGENRLRMRLWEELNPGDPLDRRCVYTGDQISIGRLFSPEVEVEHILPFSRTLDNGPANRTVSMRYANRAKVNESPFEAFGHGPTIDGRRYDWQAILERVKALPKNKQWRFAPDAMQKFEGERDFLDRQITDTAYLARATKEYLGHLCHPDKVWAIPGRLTAMLRGKWGLNSLLSDANLKNRTDHRHHAIDAVVAAVTDRGLLQRVATAAGASRERLIDEMPEPWEGFRDHVRDAVGRIVVSHKPDHGTQGALHEETAYGLVEEPVREDGHNLVFRKFLVALNENEIERIRDKELRRRVLDHVKAAKAQLNKEKLSGAELKQALAAFGEPNGVRRARLLKKEADVIGIAGPDGKPYKAYSPGDNHHIDVFVLPDGAWDGDGVTVFQSNQNCFVPEWRRNHPTARLVMRVHKDDLLKLDVGGTEYVMRVVRLEPSAKRLRLAGHLESGDLQKRHDDPDDPFRWDFANFSKLKDRRARKIAVDVLGRVHDPGFKP